MNPIAPISLDSSLQLNAKGIALMEYLEFSLNDFFSVIKIATLSY